MAIDACINGAVATALLALLLVPPEYLLPRQPRPSRGPRPLPGASAAGPPAAGPSPPYLPAADVVLAGCVLLAALATYPCDWVQRKLLERRIQKLKQQVSECTEAVRGSEARSRRAERALRTARAATSEYELLLYLLLRRHRLGAWPRDPQPDCPYRDEPDGDPTYAQKVL